MCVQSCQAKVIETGPAQDLLARMAQLGKKTVVFRP